MIAHVSAIFLLPVFEKWPIFSGFSAIMHRISTALGGNTVLCDSKSRRRTMDGSVMCWFPWKHPMALYLAAIQNRARYRCPTNLPHQKLGLGPSGLDLRRYGPQHEHRSTSARPEGSRLSSPTRLGTTPLYSLLVRPQEHIKKTFYILVYI